MEQITVRSTSELIRSFNTRKLKTNPIFIGIDGKDSSGKTPIARELRAVLGAEIQELDDLLTENKGAFVNFINYKKLKEKIEMAQAAEKTIVVEGVCLLKVLERLGSQLDILVYVKRLNSSGSWVEGFVCTPQDDPGARETVLRIARPGTLAFEVIEYHQNYKPVLKADYFFERVESP